MYFTKLPDATEPGYNEQRHFSKFGKHNIVFNASASESCCDQHVGCLSLKTVLKGEEWYGVGNRQIAVRPNQFLVLNNDQSYSSHINAGEGTRVVSIFFKKEFAAAVLKDALYTEDQLLSDPHGTGEKIPEFFQTLHQAEPALRSQLLNLVDSLDKHGYNNCLVDEHLVLLLHHLISVQQAELCRSKSVNAIKPGTKAEVYKRLCVARDMLHSCFSGNPDLTTIGETACLSVPQLVRQFKAVFHITPHQYLNRVKLEHAAHLLRSTHQPLQQITWLCGFEDVSAFCRAFKGAYGIQPGHFRSGRKGVEIIAKG